MRAALVLLLVAVAGLSALPRIQQTFAHGLAQVNLPPAEPARYAISAGGLVHCDVPTAIVLRRNSVRTGAYFRCVNRYGAPVTLNWTALNADGFVAASGGDLLPADATVACRSASLEAFGIMETRTVTFRGETAENAPFYARIHFTAEVTVQNSNAGIGGGCP